MSGSHNIPLFKVSGTPPSAVISSPPSTMTVTNMTSTAPRMLVPAVLIPSDGSGTQYTQFIPTPSATHTSSPGQAVNPSTSIQPYFISGVSGGGPHQGTSNVYSVLTPVLAQDKSLTRSPQTILHTTNINASPGTLMHAVQLPPKQKIKILGSKKTTSLLHDDPKKNNVSPPPLLPITASQQQRITVNKLKHMGGYNQFKRIQPYPTPTPPPQEPQASSSNDQSLLRVQIKQGNFGDFKSYAGKPINDPSVEKKVFKDRSTIKESPIKGKEHDPSLPVNEFPNLIKYHGLTNQRPIAPRILPHIITSREIMNESKDVTAVPVVSSPRNFSITSSSETISEAVIIETPKEELPPPSSPTKLVITAPVDQEPLCPPPTNDTVAEEAPEPEQTDPSTLTTTLTNTEELAGKTEPEKEEETVEKSQTPAEKSSEKSTEETDSNKGEEDFFLTRRQFKRPSILGGRKKYKVNSPILANTLKKVVPAAKKTEPAEVTSRDDTKEETLEIKSENSSTPTEIKSEKKEESIKGSDEKIPELQNILKDFKPPHIEDKVAEDFDPTKVLDWQDGVGVLPGSNLKFKLNEFGMMEMVEGEEDNKDEGESEAPKDDTATQPEKTETPEVKTEEVKKPPAPEVRKRARKEKLSPDDIYCCENCGCYGMACEFKTQRFCSDTCEEATSKRRAALGRRQVELEEQRLKRKKKRLQDSRNKQESGEDTASSTTEGPNLPDSQELLDKVGTPATSATPTSTAHNSPSQTPAGSDEDTNMSTEPPKPKAPLLPWQVVNSLGETLFSWSKYLEHLKARAAPTKLFPEGGFPYQRNAFRVGMRLEGIDPRTPSQLCALSVADVKGYRIKLHFEGWPDTNDFWVNADSRDIFTVGFCEKTNRSLIPPRGYPKTTFSWTSYLKLLKANAAPRQLFLHRPATKNAVGPSGFRVGMKLEAVDKQNQELVCVASVADILDGRVLIHFDSWDHTYDYWVEPTSPYIHPVGWCDQNRRTLTPPNGYTEFDWESYLKETKRSAVPSRAFKPKPIPPFKKGMKLECVDPRFTHLIRVATVNDCKGHRIQISFDGWPLETAVWMDCDSPDIHPMGWCNKTQHPLTPPPGPNQEHYCMTPGCRALLKNSQLLLPHSCSACPLTSANLANFGNKAKKIPIKENIAPRRRVESSDGDDFHQESEEEEDEEEEEVDDVKEYADVEEKVESPAKKRKTGNGTLKSLRLGVHESIFSPGYTPSPLEMPLSWSKHAYLLNIENMEPLSNKEVKLWNPQQVQNFVSTLPGCEEKSTAFVNENIDGEALLMLTQSDLISMLGFKVGPAIKLFSSIDLLKNKKDM